MELGMMKVYRVCLRHSIRHNSTYIVGLFDTDTEECRIVILTRCVTLVGYYPL